jgi:hypothetical protein
MRRKNFALVLAALTLLAAGRGAPRLQEGTQVGEVPLTAIGAEAFEVLQGPFDQTALTFQIPPNWQIQDDSALVLDLQNFFSSFVPAQGEISQEELVAGNLSVALDGATIFRSVLCANRAQPHTHTQSAAAFDPNAPAHQLNIAWDASASCDLNLSSTILLDPESALMLNFAEAAITPSLALLPYPFFASSPLEPADSVIVLPNDPNEAQVAAGLTAAAALGRFAPNQAINLTTENALGADNQTESHLIYVGPVESFTSLQGIVLPHRNDATLRLPAGSRPELGFVEVARSPWNVQRALLVISGGSDAAVLRAATAVGGPLPANSAGDLALVDENALADASPADFESATFAQLGQNDASFSHFGAGLIDIPFYISPERQISDTAFLDLRFAHSQLLDYLRSSLTVSANGEAVGTVRLADQSAQRHSELVLLSPSVLKPGLNHVQIAADVQPLNICAGAVEGNHWLTVFSDSSVNIPDAEVDPEAAAVAHARLTFDNFPLPFLADGMRNTALMLPADDPAAWASAARLLRGLAASYQTWPLQPQIRFGTSTAFAGSTASQTILVGGFNDFLADPEMQAAFSLARSGSATGELRLSSGAVVPYAAEVPLGTLALGELSAPAGPALAVLATGPAELDQAVAVVTAPNFATQNRGVTLIALQNNAAIRDNGALAPEEQPAGQAGETPSETPQPISNGKSFWLLPLLVLMLAAFGLAAWAELAEWLKGRAGK